MSDSATPCTIYTPWNSSGQNTGVDSHSLLQRILPTQGSNPGFPHCRHILYHLSHQESPRILEWVASPFSSGSSWHRNQNGVSWTAGRFFTSWTTREALKFSIISYDYSFTIQVTLSAVLQHQFNSVAQSCPTLCDPMNRSTPGLPVHHQLQEFTQTHVHRVGDAIQPSHPLLSPSPPAPNPSQHQGLPMSQLFTWSGQSVGVSASASVLPKNTQDWSSLGWTWLDLLAVQGTLKSLLQHHSSKASILQRSAFFTVQLSHPYMNISNT